MVGTVAMAAEASPETSKLLDHQSPLFTDEKVIYRLIWHIF